MKLTKSHSRAIWETDALLRAPSCSMAGDACQNVKERRSIKLSTSLVVNKPRDYSNVQEVHVPPSRPAGPGIGDIGQSLAVIIGRICSRVRMRD